MARIFYLPNGDVIGVHPGPHEGNPKIRLPDGTAWIDVPEAPHEIAWPAAADLPGSERTSMVRNGQLQAKPGAAQNKDERLQRMLRAHDLTIADLKTIINRPGVT